MKIPFCIWTLLIVTFCTPYQIKAQVKKSTTKETEPIVTTHNPSSEDLTLSLVVGVSKYRNIHLNLKYAHKDAIDFAKFLRSKVGGSVPKENIILLIDSMATSSQIYSHLEDLLIRVKKEEKSKKLRIVLFFSMHKGAFKDSVNSPEKGYLLTYDTDKSFPSQSSILFERLHQFEQSLLQRENTKVEVYIDACRAGLGVELNHEKLLVTELLRNWDNVLRIVSCSPHESSYERENGENGIFTYYLIEGLNGYADEEDDGVKDGKISAIELINHLRKKIKKELGKEKQQTPRLWGKDGQTLAVLQKNKEQLINRKRFELSNQILLKNETFTKLNISDYDSIIALNYYLKGTVLYDSFSYIEALECFRNAIAIKRDFAEAYYFTGIVLNGLIRNEDALEAFDKAIALKPNYAEAYFYKGLVFDDLNRKKGALIAFDKAIALKPDFADVYYNKGVVLSDLNRKEEALIAYDKVIALKPDFAEAYNNKGAILSDLDYKEEALIAYNKAITLKHDLAQSYYNKGIVLSALNRKEEALIAYDKAIELKPDYANAYNYKGIVLNDLNRKDEALKAYYKAIEHKPNFAEAYYNKGNTLLALNQISKALVDYEIAIVLKPDYAEAYYNKGIVLEDLNRYEDALKTYDKAIELKPDYADAYFKKGWGLLAFGYFEKVFETFDQYLILVPNNLEMIKFCALLADKNKKPCVSIKYWNQYIQLQPTDVDAWNSLSGCFLSVKDYINAKKCFEKSIALNPQQQNPYYNLSCIHSLQNQSKEALSYLEQALQKGYNNFAHIKEDTDLDNIRALREFSELIKKYQK